MTITDQDLHIIELQEQLRLARQANAALLESIELWKDEVKKKTSERDKAIESLRAMQTDFVNLRREHQECSRVDSAIEVKRKALAELEKQFEDSKRSLDRMKNAGETFRVAMTKLSHQVCDSMDYFHGCEDGPHGSD